MHIGLIGGIGPAATVFYYDRLVTRFAEAGALLHLTIANSSAAELSRNVSAGNSSTQAREFLRLTRQLQAAGADAVVISSMGGHFCASEFAPLSPLPLIDGPTCVAEYLLASGMHRIGILGTRVVMRTALYGALAQLQTVVPEGDDLDTVNDDYIAIATAGHANPKQSERLLDAGRRLVHEQGAEAILLGGTDLNVVYREGTYDFAVVDSAAVHVDAIARQALASSS